MNVDHSRIHAVVVDWDETVTQSDTIGVLAAAAYNHKPDMLPEWNHYQDEYYKDYCVYKEKFGPRTTLDSEIRFLSGLKPVEVASITRISKAGVFADVPISYISKYVQANINYRPGWWDFAQNLNKKKIPLIILSVNWCATMIKDVFSQHSVDLGGIYCNDLDQKNGICTGIINGDLQTAKDKLDTINTIISTLIPGKAAKVAYFGDSTTDLLCLLRADISCLVGKPNVNNLLANFGEPTVAFASDFEQITIS